ncbi:MAG TPA: hypothetical protein VGC95_13800, partial [Chitinophagaceae bacterium]
MPRTICILILLGFYGTVCGQGLKGRLLNPANNRPLQGATVNLAPVRDTNIVQSALSDSSGF